MNDDRALAYVAAGLGVTVMPDGYAAPGVVRPKLEGFEFTRTLGLHFAPHADRDVITAALTEGWGRLAALPGAVKLFVPPWNAVHPVLPRALDDAGYLGWSAWDAARSPGPPPRVDAHLDLLRWGGGARFRGAGAFLARMTRLLAQRRKAGDWAQPIGVLTHHLDHDEAAWRFLAQLLARRDLDWRGLPDLLG